MGSKEKNDERLVKELAKGKEIYDALTIMKRIKNNEHRQLLLSYDFTMGDQDLFKHAAAQTVQIRRTWQPSCGKTMEELLREMQKEFMDIMMNFMMTFDIIVMDFKPLLAVQVRQHKQTDDIVGLALRENLRAQTIEQDSVRCDFSMFSDFSCSMLNEYLACYERNEEFPKELIRNGVISMCGAANVWRPGFWRRVKEVFKPSL